MSTPKKRSAYGDAVRRFKKNKLAVIGFFVLIFLILVAIFADFIAPFPYDLVDFQNTFAPPSAEHFFGTDELGRDIFSRVVYGSRISLQVGLVAVSFSAIIGVLLGLAAGYFGGTVDTVIMRCIDVALAIPSILLAIAITAALGNELRNVMIAVGVGSIPSYARVMRASVLAEKNKEYVEAARSISATDTRIIFWHILPNCMAPAIVQATQNIASAILIAASLSFIGLGVQAPVPEWGAMLSTAREHLLLHGTLALYPGVAIMLAVLALNMVGDGLRDALDPRLKS